MVKKKTKTKTTKTTNTIKTNKNDKTIKITKTNTKVQPNKVMKAGLIASIILGILGFALAVLLLIVGIFVINKNALWERLNIDQAKINTVRTIFIIISSMWIIIDTITIILCIRILRRRSDNKTLVGSMALISGLLIGGILILLGKFERITKKEVHVVS